MTEIIYGDARTALDALAPASVQCIVTSPPYWQQRVYGASTMEIGREPTIAAYVAALVDVFRACRRVLRPDGVLWLNLGDRYSGDSKWGGASGAKNSNSQTMPRERVASGYGEKCLLGLPWRVALALIDDGWLLRNDVIWHKPNGMPESVTDRLTQNHEYVFLFAASTHAYFDVDAIAEPAITTDRSAPRGSAAHQQKPNGGRREKYSGIGADSAAQGRGARLARPGRDKTNETGLRRRRSVWSIPTQPSRIAHFAMMPEAIPDLCIRASTRAGDTVLDPFAGTGTTLRVAERLGRAAIGVELYEDYADAQRQRLTNNQLELLV